MFWEFWVFDVYFVVMNFVHRKVLKFVDVQENNIPFMETSAKSGKNVRPVFDDIAK